MKVYIGRNYVTVKHYFIHVYFCEATDSIQYRLTNANLLLLLNHTYTGI